MLVTLPPRLYKGKTIRVNDLASAQVLIDLDFGVHVVKTVAVEGLDPARIARPDHHEAQRALVTLLGGRSIFLLMAPSESERVIARVYLAERIHAPPECGMNVPLGLSEPFLEITSMMGWLARHHYAKEMVVRVLNGDLESART